jgi:hypothetical protein
MRSPGPVLAASLSELRTISECLQRDTLRCMGQLAEELKQLHLIEGERDYTYASYLIKKAIRAFVSQVDGVAFALRQAVLDCADEMGLSLTVEVSAILSEKKYDKATNSILDGTKHLYTIKSTLLAFQYFPQLFGSSYKLDASGVEWRSFERLVKVRNSITHPRCLDDLGSFNANLILTPTLLWFSQEVELIVFDCARSIGIMRSPIRDKIDYFATYDEHADPLRRVFRSEDDRIIDADLSRLLQFADVVFSRTSDEVTRALKEVNCEERWFLTPDGQADARNAVRTLFSAVEARVFVAQRVLKAANKLRYISLSAEDFASIARNKPVEERFAGTLALWSRSFGRDYQPQMAGVSWEKFSEARDLRDRITHPKTPIAFRFEIEEVNLLIAALSYFSDSTDALIVDGTKWAALRSNIGQAGGSAQAEERE